MGKNKIKSDRQEIFGNAGSGYLWCLKCERTYPESEYREVRNNKGQVYQMCPYKDCDGDAVIDAWDWAKIRDAHPQYPEIPECGIIYPQY